MTPGILRVHPAENLLSFAFANPVVFKDNRKLTYVILINQDDPDIMKKVFDKISFKINFSGKYADQITVFSFSGVERLVLEWVKNGFDMTVEELAGLIEDIFDQLLKIQ